MQQSIKEIVNQINTKAVGKFIAFTNFVSITCIRKSIITVKYDIYKTRWQEISFDYRQNNPVKRDAYIKAKLSWLVWQSVTKFIDVS